MAYYTATGNPGTQTSGRSGTIREEFLLIQEGFGQASNDIQALAAAVGIGVATTENDIASATVTDIGNGLGNVLRITGTNAINSFGANYTGAKQLRFAGILTLLNNPALLLPGGANITTEPDDVCIAVPIGNPANGWRVLAYCRMSEALLEDDAVRKSDAGAQVVAGTLQSAGFIGNLVGNVSGTATNVTGTVGIANGGTGATTAATARGALGAAASGANADITSLTALAVGGLPNGSVTPADLSQPLTSGTAVAATGTSVDFTGIPSWVKRITMMLDVVSTNGSSLLRVRIGPTGGVETTGYVGASGVTAGTSTSATFSSGFDIASNNAATTTQQGIFTLALINSATNTWVASWTIGNAVNSAVGVGGGAKPLAGVLARLSLTTVNGTDTFDGSGVINILYEG